jgi:hypothetical protein
VATEKKENDKRLPLVIDESFPPTAIFLTARRATSSF